MMSIFVQDYDLTRWTWRQNVAFQLPCFALVQLIQVVDVEMWNRCDVETSRCSILVLVDGKMSRTDEITFSDCVLVQSSQLWNCFGLLDCIEPALESL